MNHLPNNKILLIEDDSRLAISIAKFLNRNGFDVKHFVNGDNLEELVVGNEYGVILCDVMLPGTDGFQIAERLRGKFDGSYIFLTSLDAPEHQLKGFELGADDYIGKPIDPRLLLARIQACLRRKLPKNNTQQVSFTNLHIDNDSKAAVVEGKRITLSKYEFELLWLLAIHQGQPLSREYLFVNTVGREYDGMDRTVDGRVSRLRKKLEHTKNIQCAVYTSWGKGYMLVEKPI